MGKSCIRDIVGLDGMDNMQVNALVRKADRLKDGMITFDFFIRAMFDDTPPLVPYKPPRRHNFIVQALLNTLGCGINSDLKHGSHELDMEEEAAPRRQRSRG